MGRKTEQSGYSEMMCRYLSTLESRGRSGKTVELSGIALMKFENSLNSRGVKGCGEIGVEDVEEWMEDMREEGLKNSSVRAYLTAARGFFEWLMRIGVRGDNPILREYYPDVAKEVVEIPSRGQIEQMIAYEPERRYGGVEVRDKAIVLVLVLSGIRNQELRDLRLDDLDFGNGLIRVVCGKGSKGRLVAFPKRAQEAVERYLNSGLRPKGAGVTAPLFGSVSKENGKWKKLTNEGLRKIVRRYGEDSIGWQDMHPHLLRHCATSYWDAMGVPMRAVQRALGHASIGTTERVYLHVLESGQAAREITNVLEQRMG